VSIPSHFRLLVRGGVAEAALRGYFNTGRQSDLDAGWGNFDARGGFGLPTAEFRAWRLCGGFGPLTVSPRDANQTGARELPGYADTTFEPEQLLDTYCGGLDAIMPSVRDEGYLSKFFLYGSYIDRPRDWLGLFRDAEKAADELPLQSATSNLLERFGLRLTQLMMAQVLSAGADAPLGAYALGDGFVPLQSQLLLDGTETERVYETELVNGWEVATIPYRHRADVINAHTLVDPARVRILVGWSHVDTVTGRYDEETGDSGLFDMVAADLLSAVP
ncbi:MAG: hypothetical protein JXR94_03165, partial [Candidatus Hydrogenedentes bacterium]|nr:hypothetical protein [Candidatus Hydrogenedentota bacterium]